MKQFFNSKYDKSLLVNFVNILEIILGILVIMGTAWYVFVGMIDLVPQIGNLAFYLIFIEIVLTAIIGAEVVRLLITHDIHIILEILGFILARKVLSPDTVVVEVLIACVAFLVLVCARKILLEHTILTSKNSQNK